MARRYPSYAPRTLRAAEILGMEISRARRSGRISRAELAERAGLAPNTLTAIERGSPNVAIGSYFEVAHLVGLDVLADDSDLAERHEQSRQALALLPSRVRSRAVVDDDF